MAVTEESLRLLDQLRQQVLAITDRHQRDIIAAYARGWDSVAGDLDAALQDLTAAAKDGRVTRAMIYRSERLTRALAHIGQELTALARDARVLVIGDLEQVVRQAGETQAAIITSQLPGTLSSLDLVVGWSRISTDAVDAIVTRTADRITTKTRPLSAEATRTMKRELVRGVAVGANPGETARRMLAGTEGTFLGGAARAETIARTETLDAHRAASLLSRQANADVLASWMWIAQLDPRTCPSCLAQHGSVHPVDEPGPIDHPRGRCDALPLTRSWRDLGIDLDEPPAIPVLSGEEWLRAQPEAVQVQTLGRARLDALDRGVPFSALSTRRSADGWRDAYYATPARDLVDAD